ncbi:MAG: ABC transporter ATP-binding protein [Pseudomonadota bacterium]
MSERGNNRLLVTQGLAWGYGKEPLAGHLDMDLSVGELVAVVGPNGVGKTSLLQTLDGRLKPLQGKVLLQGEDIALLDSAQRAKRVAVLSQVSSADPDLTVKELVELGRTPYLGLWGGLRTQDREEVEKAIEACHLQRVVNRKLGQISGGEQQRARIAMVIAQRAPLLFLDEPVSHLDLRHSHELFQLLAKLRKERGMGILMVLHNLTEAYREADRVLVLAQGRVSQISDNDPGRTQKLAEAFDVPENWIPL